MPRQITPIFPISKISAVLPKSRFYRVLGHNWDERKICASKAERIDFSFRTNNRNCILVYKDAPLKTFILRPVMNGVPHIFTSSLSVLVQTTALAGAFIKPQHVNVALELFGDNVVIAEGDVWKRHRRVTAPAFGPEAIRNVWETTARVYSELLETQGWRGDATKIETPVINVNNITHKVGFRSVVALYCNVY